MTIYWLAQDCTMLCLLILLYSVAKRCLVIDRRSHLGGNVYCTETEGIHVHQYGPHIFHTDNKLALLEMQMETFVHGHG